MKRALPSLVVVLALAGVLAIAGLEAWRTATAHGWLEDGYRRLARDVFWYRFDHVAPLVLAGLVALLVVSALRGWMPPGRRELALPLLVVIAACVARTIALVHDATCPHRPNVLLVSIDTLRAERLGTYGYARPTSPTLDARLAAAGVVFENAWSQSPKTTPSHMTMLTSLYPATHGVPLWEGAGSAPAPNPRVHTLAAILKNEGYATAAFTAGAHVHRDRGFVQGFDVYKHGDQLARALEFLRARGRRPFFRFFHTYEVHYPYTPPPELAAAFATVPVPAIAAAVEQVRAGVAGWLQAHKRFWAAVDGSDPRHVRYVSDLYDAGIRRMDGTTLATLLDELDRLGIAGDTLVVFTSDHGEAFREHGHFFHENLYPETLRVPLVLRFPHRLPAGYRVLEPVGLVDLLPTVLDLLTVPVPAQAQGTSFAALARGEDDPPPRGPTFAEFSTAGRRFESVRQNGLTLIRANDDVAVFDHGADPGETRDLGPSAPARAATLRAELERWHDANVALAGRLGPRESDVAAPSAETVEQLRALGYVE